MRITIKMLRDITKRRKHDLKTEKQGHLDVRGRTKMVVIMPFGIIPPQWQKRKANTVCPLIHWH